MKLIIRIGDETGVSIALPLHAIGDVDYLTRNALAITGNRDPESDQPWVEAPGKLSLEIVHDHEIKYEAF